MLFTILVNCGVCFASICNGVQHCFAFVLFVAILWNVMLHFAYDLQCYVKPPYVEQILPRVANNMQATLCVASGR